MGLLVCAVVAGHTTFYGLPTSSTLAALGRAWTAGLDSFRNAVAPTEVTPGLLLLSVGGTWVCATAADWLAFRGDATLTAILPPFVLYVMGAALGKDGFQLPTTFVFVVAALLFVAANHAAGLPQRLVLRPVLPTGPDPAGHGGGAGGPAGGGGRARARAPTCPAPRPRRWSSCGGRAAAATRPASR